MIDLDTGNRTDEHRNGPKRVLLAALLATAAAVIVIALVAIRKDDPGSPADQPSPTVTVPPTLPPRVLFGTPEEQFVPGTYFVDEVEGAPTPKIFVTLEAGWTNTADNWAVGKEGVGFMTFSRPDRVFSDACHSSDGFHPGPMTTLGDHHTVTRYVAARAARRSDGRVRADVVHGKLVAMGYSGSEHTTQWDYAAGLGSPAEQPDRCCRPLLRGVDRHLRAG